MKSLLYEAVDALRPIAKMLEAMKTEDNEVNFINTLKFWHVTKASEIVKKFDSAVEKTK
jgi:hypothetical protein